ncbi:hypothetical protein FOC1_g10006189 [Fusarium oxysporum f. sp. cubense race 1]|uniref:Uncharacterized protein n=1 Tax=Fusarium oxysporum f. sp. cubense (strain race 1) TaxID=1229664 RepID=N4UJ06_FUSC1|nr:hypothetical protein FOC1_g10006189 [Fusarium oxysporum f. sp. cubense race 1]
MSGFEIVGLIIGVIPIVVKGLKFYENDAQILLHHRIAMNDLIVSLHAEHSRFRHSCSVLLRGLVEDKDLEDFLDKTNKEEWEKALAQGLEKSLREKLGHRYYAYTEIIKQIQEKLETLGKVVGMGKHQQWYEKTEYENQKTWHKIKKCIKHSKHKQLLEDLEKYNTKLEQMTPGILTQAQTALSQPKKTDLSYWDSIRQAAVSLHSALCSGWLCCCAKPHLTHFQLEDRVTRKKGPHKFKLSFKMPQIGDAGQSVRNTDWQSAEFEAFEDDDLPKDLPRSPGSVAFAVGGTTASTSLKVERHIKDLCKELKQPSCQSEVRCIGFILQEEHKHYILLTSEGSRDTITLHSFLSNKATLEAQEELDDHRITEELTDFNTAERLSKAVALNNALEWNAVVDRCLRCGFHSPPDFTRKDFRAEFYQCVVVPLEKLYDDSKIN